VQIAETTSRACWHIACSWIRRRPASLITVSLSLTKDPPMSKNKSFAQLDRMQLSKVAGGAARVSARSGSTDQLTTMLTGITDSIKDLAKGNQQQDPMQMMMMMMMMGGGGGGGGAAPAPAPAPPPPVAPVVNISTSVRR